MLWGAGVLCATANVVNGHGIVGVLSLICGSYLIAMFLRGRV
jgi:hypothetical protein